MGFMNWVRTQWDRAAALLAVVIGLVAFLVGWRGVSGEAFVAKQLPYVVSGALFGIFMVGIAATLWLSADLRDEWRELRGVRVLLRDELQRSAAPAPGRQEFGVVHGDGFSSETAEIPAITVDHAL